MKYSRLDQRTVPGTCQRIAQNLIPTTNDGNSTVLVHIQYTYMFYFKNNSRIPLNFHRFIYVTPLSVGPLFFFIIFMFFCCVWIVCVFLICCCHFSLSLLPIPAKKRQLACLPVLVQPLHHCATTSLHMTSCWFHDDCRSKK